MKSMGLVLALVVCAASSAPAAEVRRRALVVAYNGQEGEGRAPLQYADDDGVAWAEVLERLGMETTLLTVPDAETARGSSSALGRARPPSREELLAAVNRIRRANASDVASGRETEVLFVYVGHGDVDAKGTAFLTLLGAELRQTELYSEVVDRLGADYVHLMVDACHASGVVGGRGSDPAALKRLRELLAKESLKSRPQVGVAFAESDSGQTHEWSRIRAGVFSHVARSALLGAADVNLDRRIEYSEFEAFVAAALSGVEELPSRMKVRTSPPTQQPRRPLVAAPPEGPEVFIPAEFPVQRLSVSDDSGIELLDVHRAVGEPLWLVLPARKAYWFRTRNREARVSRTALEDGLPELQLADVRHRGPEGAGLEKGLFLVPYGRAFYEGFIASAPEAVPVSFAASVEAPRRGARVPLWARGFEVGGQLGQAALGASGLGYGVYAAWRAGDGAARWGARLEYAVAPRGWSEAGTLHRLALQGTLAWEPVGTFGPFAQLGVGLAPEFLAASFGTQRSLFVPTASARVGARMNAGPFNLRLGLGGNVDVAFWRGNRRAFFVPVGELGVELGPRPRSGG